MKTALSLIVLLSLGCAVLSYRAQAPGGLHSLPSIGKYPSPTVFNPKNQGLPDAYKHFRTLRSVDDQIPLERGHFAQESEPALPVHELSRQRRSTGNRFTHPTLSPSGEKVPYPRL